MNEIYTIKKKILTQIKDLRANLELIKQNDKDGVGRDKYEPENIAYAIEELENLLCSI